jgi:hypothetical protein
MYGPFPSLSSMEMVALNLKFNSLLFVMLMPTSSSVCAFNGIGFYKERVSCNHIQFSLTRTDPGIFVSVIEVNMKYEPMWDKINLDLYF